MRKLSRTDADWRRQLTAEQYEVARGRGTERPFCGAFHDHKQPGLYSCVCCGLPLFDAGAKFDSGTGWPSFFTPVAPEHVATREDAGHGMRRTEILCARCDAHLGHVFPDGPAPTGLRHCLNSVSLAFAPLGTLERATFAAGCFWGVEAAFRAVPGVRETAVGYTGGQRHEPAYEDVCAGATGHAEAVAVDFDPSRVTYEGLLEAFFACHDPTTRDRQGPDVGEQYRSAIFWHAPAQRDAAEARAAALRQGGLKVVTQVEPAWTFYRAEEYHQRYHERRGGACGR